MSDTQFVIIHGLASKPRKDVLLPRYHRYLQQGAGTDIDPSRVRLAYWADLMGYEPDGPDRDEFDWDSDGATNFQPYSLWEQIKFNIRGFVRSRLVNRVEQRLHDSVEDPARHEEGARSIGEELPSFLAHGPAKRVYERFIPDMHRYFFGGQRERVRQRLRDELAVTGDSPVCLIAHSMGSIIATDLIIADGLKLDTFITIGAPVGIEVVKDQMEVNDGVKERLQTQIGNWFNLYDRLDVIALDSDLADDYAPTPVLDVRIRNEFVTKDGDRNHHKSYGYLCAPEMGEIIRELV